MSYVGSLLGDVGWFLWLGGAGLILGTAAAFLLSRTALRRAIMVLLGFVGFVATEGYWIWWGTGSCGESCIRDPTLGVVFGVFNFFTYFVGAVIGLAIADRMGKIDHAATVRRNTRTAVVAVACALVLLMTAAIFGWPIVLVVPVVVASIAVTRRRRSRTGGLT